MRFLLGVVTGVAVGVLYAPQEGSKTRKMVSDRISDWVGETGNKGNDLAESGAADTAVAEVLNTARRDELMSVDGIGKGRAKRIIKNRPYENGKQVVQEGVLPEETLEKLKEQLVDPGRDVA